MRITQSMAMRVSQNLRAGWVNAPNKMPQFQRMMQRPSNERPWYKAPRSKYMLYPYFTMFYVALAGSTWMLVRMTLGKRTWFGSK